jgi:hypothetical protein
MPRRYVKRILRHRGFSTPCTCVILRDVNAKTGKTALKGKPPKTYVLTKQVTRSVIERVRAGWTVEGAARAVGVSANAVYAAIHRHGLAQDHAEARREARESVGVEITTRALDVIRTHVENGVPRWCAWWLQHYGDQRLLPARVDAPTTPSGNGNGALSGAHGMDLGAVRVPDLVPSASR